MNEEYPSPDNLFLLMLGCNEMRMSHWVCSPLLQERSSGRILFRAGPLWDASSIQWSDDSKTLRFSMRKYPGAPEHHYAVVIRMDNLSAAITGEGNAVQLLSLEELSARFTDG
jgi:hypothetical protein